MTSHLYDVLVVGGGAAGLSGAATLARARVDVLVVDAGDPRNAPAEGVHSFLSRDGMPPADLLAVGRDELASYGGSVVAGEVVSAERTDAGFVAHLADGTTYAARRLLVTTGARDELPDVPGLAEHWGTSVVHCPFCHGAEIADQRIAVLATSPIGVAHGGMLWSQWTDRLTVLLHEQPEPDAETAALLAARGVTVVAGRVEGVVTEAGRLAGVTVEGRRVDLDAIAVATYVRARSAVLESLGAEPTEMEMMGTKVATFVEGQPMTGLTTVPGVYVAGNVASPMAQVITSASAGVHAAGAIVMDLVNADARAKLPA